eukprot:TRINITY_DN111107_c0_g1_i1.p1 TRINITY_DN111107_c0_g1~~TRINITY_DN111107_c0_g1_i1.p1  ORF type:complete len:147 (-),score=24.65 TRINITY_DN111107_c0_g1_i1:68-508(-)
MTAPQRVNATRNLPTVSESDLQDLSGSSQAVSEIDSTSSSRFMREHLQALKRAELEGVKAMLEEKDRQLFESISRLSKPGGTLAANASIDAAFADAIPQRQQQQARSAYACGISASEVSIDLELQTHGDVQSVADQQQSRPSKCSL